MTLTATHKTHIYNLYWKENYSVRDIAKEMGLTYSKVEKFMRKYEIPRRPMKGLAKSFEHRQKLAEAKVKAKRWYGEDSPNWKGGISKTKYDRGVTGIGFWSKSVKRRDHYICQNCGLDGMKSCGECGRKPDMHADHINSWVDNPEQRLNIDNGRTLCKSCHYSLGKRGELLEHPEKENQQPS